MKTSRIGIHLTSVLLLSLWGAVMLYFYASGRISKYLQSDGLFQPMVLVAGIGLVVLALFNLVTMGAEEADCCDHDHAHDKERDHGCCGHDHPHDEASHHDHDHSTCGHDHSHDHHEHDHDHSHNHAGHAHGILDESGAAGRLVAILILAVPVSYAAMRSPDQFSLNTITNKGGYSNAVDAAGVVQHSIKNKAPTAPAPAKAPSAPPVSSVTKADSPPASQPSPSATAQPPATASAQPAPGAPAPAATAATPPPGAKDTKSYGGFTLADLEAQVPKSKAGNFILEVPELYYTAGDKEVQSVLAGQSVETIAQVLPEKVNNADGKRLRVLRMLIQCCAADARPYSIPVQFAEKAPTFKDMSWVKVTGKMSYSQESGQTVPILLAGTIEETTAPENATVY
jgi:hypothetical protein